jgi:hypothetical protein
MSCFDCFQHRIGGASNPTFQPSGLVSQNAGHVRIDERPNGTGWRCTIDGTGTCIRSNIEPRLQFPNHQALADEIGGSAPMRDLMMHDMGIYHEAAKFIESFQHSSSIRP